VTVNRTLTVTEFQRQILKIAPELEKAVIRGFRSAALRMVSVVVEEIETASPHSAVDRGELRNSVDYRPLDNGAIVQVSAPHAGIIEYGTRPFWPPEAPIVAWVLRKGLADSPKAAKGIAYAIRKSISEKGIAPRHYFAKAFERAKQITKVEVSRALIEAAK